MLSKQIRVYDGDVMGWIEMLWALMAIQLNRFNENELLSVNYEFEQQLIVAYNNRFESYFAINQP